MSIVKKYMEAHMKTWIEQRDEACRTIAKNINDERGYVPGYDGEVDHSARRGADWAKAEVLKDVSELVSSLEYLLN